MTDHILTLNAGSSSLKFALYRARRGMGGDPVLSAAGQIEDLHGQPRLKIRADGMPMPGPAQVSAAAGPEKATALVLDWADGACGAGTISAVGHRIVHGGADRKTPVRLDDATLAELERYIPFAPLHQPHNLAAVAAARARFPDAAQIGCFDTAFHRDHPRVNDQFALPRRFYESGVRRYGFHGLSYEYVSGWLAGQAPQLHAGRVVIAHLGNGASMCGLRNGRSVASTMGFSALDGLPMGTRCGQLDPGVLLYLIDQEGMSTAEIADLLYRKSGLLGLSGLSHDMRVLERSDAPQAREAIDYFTFRIRRELGGLSAALGGLDALVFTGGIGENSALIRALVCARLDWIGIDFDLAANTAGAAIISTPLSRVQVLIVPTDEEMVIARAARALSA